MKFFIPLIIIFSITCSSCKKIGRGAYRNDYLGHYNFTITHKSWDYFANTSTTYETTSIGKIEKFNGFSGNQLDIHHKIGVYLDTSGHSSTPPSQSPCLPEVTYYADNFYHPTVSNTGSLSYPECDCNEMPSSKYQFSHATIWPDSIKFEMHRGDANHSSTRKITGIRIP